MIKYLFYLLIIILFQDPVRFERVLEVQVPEKKGQRKNKFEPIPVVTVLGNNAVQVLQDMDILVKYV